VTPARPAARPAVVVLSERLGAVTAQERRLEAAGAVVRGAPLWTREDIVANAAGAEVVILGAVEPFDAAAMERLPGLLAVVRRGVGHDNVDLDAASRLGIVVANVPDASVEEVSDHALALLLAVERAVPWLDAAVHEGRWRHDPAEIEAIRRGARRLNRLTLGVVGFGRIGRALARKARAVYGRVVASDPVVAPDEAARAGVELLGLDDLLGAADHVSLHAPLLPATRHLIGARALAAMRPGAVLVNTSRGGLVDEAAVLAAVESGHLRGAGLDVTGQEPLAPDDPLLRSRRVVLTAHPAAASSTTAVELVARSVDAAIDLVNGRRPASVVNEDVLASPALRHRALARTDGSGDAGSAAAGSTETGPTATTPTATTARPRSDITLRRIG